MDAFVWIIIVVVGLCILGFLYDRIRGIDDMGSNPHDEMLNNLFNEVYRETGRSFRHKRSILTSKCCKHCEQYMCRYNSYRASETITDGLLACFARTYVFRDDRYDHLYICLTCGWWIMNPRN